MKTIRFSGTTENHSTPIDLGRQGENLARIIDIDISAWRAEFGEGTVQLLHQRPGDSTPYPAAVEQAGDVVRWEITAADTARAGYGAAQLLFYAGDVLAKQCIYRTCVSPSLGQSAGEPPEAQQPWVERVLAEAAKVTGMTARAVELPAGTAPTADYADGILTIGIPLGDVSEDQVAQAVADYLAAHPIQERDPTVPDWAKQPNKPRYTADEVGAIAQTELQAAVDTALAQAKASGAFDGASGQQGEQGPQGETGVGIQSVVQTTEATEDGGTNVITVTKTDGTISTFAVRNGSTGPAGADGKDGAPGADGQDGTTPTIGDNGNWFIGDTDTGKPSRGEIGPAGADGKSAYAYAVEGGYTGTEEAFAVKLAADIPAVDSTLTQPGQAADAKTVGDALSTISEELANFQTSGLTTERVNALDGLFKIVAYTADPASAYSAFKVAFGLDGGGTGVTLSSISATYSGGDVAVGTALSALTGIVVTATYSDGSTATVTGYTLSGEIAEGSNTITVTYQGKTATFIVTGTEVTHVYTVTNHLTNVTNSNSATTASGYYSATLSAEDGYNINVTITMGGVDITADVYTEDGTILIAEVTGDIVITATAELASSPIIYQLANTPRTVNADLYEDTGLTFGSNSANGYTKAWTMVAKVKNMSAGYLWCVAGQDNLSAKYENRWNGDVGNNVSHLTTAICATVVRPSITQVNPDEISVVITKEALSEKTATVYYLNYAGELQTSQCVGTYGKFLDGLYAGNMMVGGKSSADFVGTIEEFTIYEGVATAEQIKSYLGVA